MKRLILLASFLVISFFSIAQGNLQFSQVVRSKTTGTTVNGTTNYASTITVPSGTVWKIESASVLIGSGTGSSAIYSAGNATLTVDGQIVYVLFYTDENYIYLDNKYLLPLWLGPGTYSVNLYTGNLGAGSTYNTVLSGLQFNVVQ